MSTDLLVKNNVQNVTALRSSWCKNSAQALPTHLTQSAMKIINYEQVETIKIFDVQRKRFYELH